MDKSLARGYTNMYLRSLPGYADVSPRLSGASSDRLLDIIHKARGAKSCARSLQKLRGALGPHFRHTEILRSGRRRTCGLSVMITSVKNVGTLASYDDEEPLFREEAVEFGRLVLQSSEEEARQAVYSTASISPHAIMRLLQRDAIPGEKLEADIAKALYLADHVIHRIAASHSGEEIHDRCLLLPFRSGALVLVSVPRLAPSLGTGVEKISYRLAIRTFLAPEMLTPQDRNRISLLRDELTGLKISQLRGPAFCNPERTSDEEDQVWRRIMAEGGTHWTAQPGWLETAPSAPQETGAAQDAPTHTPCAINDGSAPVAEKALAGDLRERCEEERL